MTKNCSGKLWRAGQMVAIAAIGLGTSMGAFAQNALVDVDPDSAPFNRPTEITLEGDFNTGALNQIQVFFSQSGQPNPASDARAVVLEIGRTGDQITSIVAVTPRVSGPSDSNVYVVNTNDNPDLVTNTLDFTFTAGGNSRAALASALLEQFDRADADNNGSLSFNEARTIIPDLTQEEFDAIDTNDDGQLSQDEIRAAIGRPGICQRNGNGPPGLGGLFAFGLVAALLSIWEGIRRRLFPSTHSWVPDVDQRDNGRGND